MLKSRHFRPQLGLRNLRNLLRCCQRWKEPFFTDGAERNPVSTKSGVSSSFLPEKMNRHRITPKDELTPDYPPEPERRARWRRKVRGEQPAKELDGVRSSVRSGRPYGAEDWVEVISHRLGIVREPRRRGRPPREKMPRHRNSFFSPGRIS